MTSSSSAPLERGTSWRRNLANCTWDGDNCSMTLNGHIENGVVVLDGGGSFPEGTRVAVSPIPSVCQPTETEIVLEPGKLPYVRGGIPGTWNLTNEAIAQISEEEEIAAMKGKWNVPS